MIVAYVLHDEDEDDYGVKATRSTTGETLADEWWMTREQAVELAERVVRQSASQRPGGAAKNT